MLYIYFYSLVFSVTYVLVVIGTEMQPSKERNKIFLMRAAIISSEQMIIQSWKRSTTETKQQYRFLPIGRAFLPRPRPQSLSLYSHNYIFYLVSFHRSSLYDTILSRRFMNLGTTNGLNNDTSILYQWKYLMEHGEGREYFIWFKRSLPSL